MKDKLSLDRINKLHPAHRQRFQSFIEEAENALGITLRVAQGLRTFAEQDALYALGRTEPNADGASNKKPLGNIVTKAKGGSSYHNYGLAIDVAQLLDGKINWNFDYSLLKPFADKYNLEWGGLWRFVDKPHFQYTVGTIAQLKKMKVSEGYVVLG